MAIDPGHGSGSDHRVYDRFLRGFYGGLKQGTDAYDQGCSAMRPLFTDQAMIASRTKPTE